MLIIFIDIIYIYIYTHVLVLIESWPFFGLLQGGVATQCIQLELVDLKRRPSGLQHAGVPESRCSGNDRSLEFWCLGEAVFYILLYSIHIYCIHRERERERERERKRSTLFSWIFFHRAWSLPWFFGASIVQLRQRSRCLKGLLP